MVSNATFEERSVFHTSSGNSTAQLFMPRVRLLACGTPPDRFNAQRAQDRWVLSTFAGLAIDDLYYLDIAAQEPACNSNTWALDRRGWKGLCIDASPNYALQLRRARTCKVIQAAVDSTIRNASYLAVGGYGGLIGEGFDNFLAFCRWDSEPDRSWNQ